jgi:AraC-like DNA-binding protein
MALVMQGSKSVDFGPTHLEYGAGQYLLTSIDMPVTSRIVSATSKSPLLAVGIDLDFAALRQVIHRCDTLPPSRPQPGIQVFAADSDLLEAVVRLLRLLDTPQHARALAPLIQQEILYRLLAGPSGSRLLEISRHDSPSSRVARALGWLRKHFAAGFMVGELARHAGMSPSSFHQHFKAVTGMTPIQYQKRIRLHEARRILLVDSLDIGEASLRVGYQSHSQFSKEYRQYFGRLPKDDIAEHADGGIPLAAYSPAVSVR